MVTLTSGPVTTGTTGVSSTGVSSVTGVTSSTGVTVTSSTMAVSAVTGVTSSTVSTTTLLRELRRVVAMIVLPPYLLVPRPNAVASQSWDQRRDAAGPMTRQGPEGPCPADYGG